MKLTFKGKIRYISFVFICIIVPLHLGFTQEIQQMNFGKTVGDKRSELKEIGAMIADAKSPELIMERWIYFIDNERNSGVPLDINSLVQEVLAEAYLETNRDLQDYLDRVTFFQQMKDNVRNQLTKIRQYRAERTEDANLKNINLYIDQLEQLSEKIDRLHSLTLSDLQEWEQKRSVHFSLIWHAVNAISDSAKKRLLHGQ